MSEHENGENSVEIKYLCEVDIVCAAIEQWFFREELFFGAKLERVVDDEIVAFTNLCRIVKLSSFHVYKYRKITS